MGGRGDRSSLSLSSWRTEGGGGEIWADSRGTGRAGRKQGGGRGVSGLLVEANVCVWGHERKTDFGRAFDSLLCHLTAI
jgi:hypothetical protein